MSSKPQLVYWELRGVAENIRMLLHYLEVDFEDTRIPFGEIGPNVADGWMNQKYSQGLDFPNIPYYIDEDVKITQSLAIMQHIGRKYNLCGDTLKDKAIIDMVAQTLADVRWQAWFVYQAANFHEIKDDWKKTIPERLSELNKFMDGKEFVLGSGNKKISYVDFLLYEALQWFRSFAPDIFEQSEGLANLNNFQKRIEALPQIKAYMESDKFKDWPFFAPFVHFGWSKDPDFKPLPASYRNWMAKYPLDKLDY